MLLYEKHRPKTLEGVIGQPAAVAKCRALLAGGLGGQALWISGPSGSGKTTLARILAAEVADGQAILEYDSPEMVTAAEMNRWGQVFCLAGAVGSKKSGWAVIVNEAHGFNQAQIRRLLGILEYAAMKGRVLFVFTTTKAGEEKLFDCQDDAGPLLSRCQQVKLTSQGLCAAFAAHVQGIATVEGLNGQPLAEYEKLMKRVKNNCRAALQAVAAGEMKG